MVLFILINTIYSVMMCHGRQMKHQLRWKEEGLCTAMHFKQQLKLLHALKLKHRSWKLQPFLNRALNWPSMYSEWKITLHFSYYQINNFLYTVFIQYIFLLHVTKAGKTLKNDDICHYQQCWFCPKTWLAELLSPHAVCSCTMSLRSRNFAPSSNLSAYQFFFILFFSSCKLSF